MQLSAEHRELQTAVRAYLDEKIAPLVAEHEAARTFPWELMPELLRVGYVGGAVREDLGGTGLPATMLAVLMEEAGRCWGSLRTSLSIQTMVAICLASCGTPEQHERFLKPLLDGSARGFFALTEPEAGSDARALRTSARIDGDEVTLNGRKLYITNALGADFGIVIAKLVGRDDQITAFIVERERSDYEVFDIPHMSVRSTTSCEVVFEQTCIPVGNMLGKAGDGLRVAMDAVNIGRLNMAMGAVGLSQACLEAATSYATSRTQFSRPLAGFQLVQQMVVEIATLTQTARLTGMHAADEIGHGGNARLACSMAKYYCAEAAGKAASLALQVHGGAGLMESSPVERYFRDAREATIPDGTSQIQILAIGRELLGVSALK